MMRLAYVGVFAMAIGCGATEPPAQANTMAASTGTPAATPHAACPGGGAEHHADSTPMPRPTADNGQAFGAEISADLAITPLADLAAAPERFRGQTVKTEGTVAQVCQHMGCWMELRLDGSPQVVRVPMAGHRFFLPRDIAGKRATVQGTVVVEQVSEAMRQHLEAEGSQAAGQGFAIEATAVVIH